MASSLLFACGKTADGTRIEVHVGDDRSMRLYTGGAGALLEPLGAAHLIGVLRHFVMLSDAPEWVRELAEQDVTSL